MCTEETERDNEHAASMPGTVDRRSFGHLSAAAIFAAAFPAACSSGGDTKSGAEGQSSTQQAPDAANTASANAGDPAAINEQRVNIAMSGGGVSDSVFFHPAAGAHAGVLMWPDIRGLRPAFEAMARRLATSGYAVLVVNPFWRDSTAPVVQPGEQFSDPEVRGRLIPMARKLTQEAAFADARDYIGFLDAQAAVDTNRKVGTAGYCMGGPLIHAHRWRGTGPGGRCSIVPWRWSGDGSPGQSTSVDPADQRCRAARRGAK